MSCGREGAGCASTSSRSVWLRRASRVPKSGLAARSASVRSSRPLPKFWSNAAAALSPYLPSVVRLEIALRDAALAASPNRLPTSPARVTAFAAAAPLVIAPPPNVRRFSGSVVASRAKPARGRAHPPMLSLLGSSAIFSRASTPVEPEPSSLPASVSMTLDEPALMASNR